MDQGTTCFSFHDLAGLRSATPAPTLGPEVEAGDVLAALPGRAADVGLRAGAAALHAVRAAVDVADAELVRDDLACLGPKDVAFGVCEWVGRQVGGWKGREEARGGPQGLVPLRGCCVRAAGSFGIGTSAPAIEEAPSCGCMEPSEQIASGSVSCTLPESVGAVAARPSLTVRVRARRGDSQQNKSRHRSSSSRRITLGPHIGNARGVSKASRPTPWSAFAGQANEQTSGGSPAHQAYTSQG